MFSAIAGDFQIGRIIAAGIFGFVVNLFARMEIAAERSLRIESMLIGVAANVGERMILADTDQHVTPRVDRSAAFPIRIRGAALISH